jgi:phage FluMu gp28-like protein
MGRDKNIDSSDLSPILLPYQQRWVDDESSLKVWLAARQVGKSFAIAMEAVIEALNQKCTNLILSCSERQSRELMQKVYMHLRYFKMRSSKIIMAERETLEEVTLPKGSRIISLPASPDTVRGFSGNIFLDEFAFHTDSEEIWRAMYPTVTRGYKVRITSTPNGKQNMFYELWTKDEKFSKHRTDIYAATSEGLKVDVEAIRKGISDPDSWVQEFQCRFLDEATAYITYAMITACESDAATKEYSVIPASFLKTKKDSGQAGMTNGELYLGVDVGRKHDLTVFWLVEKLGDIFWTRMVRVMKREPFRIQRDFLYSLLDSMKIRRCCIDSSGIGAQLAEEATERFGPRVEGITFTGAVKEDLAVTLRRRFEDRALRLPRDREIREDIHSVKKFITSAGNTRFDAGHTSAGHADRFWALALAIHAAGGAQPLVRYEPVMHRDFSLKGCY